MICPGVRAHDAGRELLLLGRGLGNGRPRRELQEERTQLGRRVRRSRGDVAGAECQAEC